jgi:hypothetical protein
VDATGGTDPLTLLPAYPIPSGDEGERWAHTRLRHRMLRGIHRQDVISAISDHVDPTRQRQWGVPDLSSNVFKTGSGQLAVCHDRAPIWGSIDGDAPKQLLGEGGFYDRAGWAPLMSRFSTSVIGLRECAMHHSIVGDKKGAADAARVLFRPVTPDMIFAMSKPSDPERPYRFQELRLRTNTATQKVEWTWDVYDIESTPYYRVFECKADASCGEDRSSMHIEGGALVGDDYLAEFSNVDGEPFIPYTLYHAAKTGLLWDAFDTMEVVNGSITAAVLWTFYVHCVRDASWPQRYAVGAVPQGGKLMEDGQSGAQSSIPTDPSSLLLFRAISDAQPILGQFSPASSPQEIQASVAEYEARCFEYLGVSAADMQRAGGNTRSGYAIAITNAGKREAQRRFAPQFRVGDLESAAMSAKLLNRRFSLGLPEKNYTIEYQAIPLSEQELEARRKDILEQVAAGLMSEIDAYMELHPGVSHEGAVRALVRVETDKLLLAKERAKVAQEMGFKTDPTALTAPATAFLAPPTAPAAPASPGATPPATEENKNAA